MNQVTESSNSKKYFVTVTIEGHLQNFEVDSGAGFTLLPRKKFNKLKLNINLQKATIAFHTQKTYFFQMEKLKLN